MRWLTSSYLRPVSGCVRTTGWMTGGLRRFISATTDINEFYGGPAVDFPWRVELANFLQSAIPPLAWSSLVLAAAFGLDLAAAHLARRSPAVAAPPIASPPPRPPVEASLDDSMWRP